MLYLRQPLLGAMGARVKFLFETAISQEKPQRNLRLNNKVLKSIALNNAFHLFPGQRNLLIKLDRNLIREYGWSRGRNSNVVWRSHDRGSRSFYYHIRNEKK